MFPTITSSRNSNTAVILSCETEEKNNTDIWGYTKKQLGCLPLLGKTFKLVKKMKDWLYMKCSLQQIMVSSVTTLT